jgi:hypothetical protein
MPEEPVTLVSLGGGACVEHFDIELERVLKNIEDVNTDPKATRVITLKVTFKPNEERQVADVHINASSKLASIKPTSTVVYMGRKGGKTMAVESNPRQSGLFDAPKPQPAPANVTPMRKD